MRDTESSTTFILQNAFSKTKKDKQICSGY